MFDILIVVAEKDHNKLPFVLESIYKNISGVNKYYIISPTAISDEYLWLDAEVFMDREVVDFDFSRFTGNIETRRGWYIQQFIKLFQEVTGPQYVVVDADVYLNKKIDIIGDDDKPTFLFGKNQYHLPYFQFMKSVFDLNKVHSYSFINEIMYFDRDIIKQMISSIGLNKYGFFELAVNELNKQNEVSGFSEYELYGNYVTKNFPDAYHYKFIKSCRNGKQREWNETELKEYINKMENSEYDLISMHSWI